ncbi:MAG TPA: Cerebroside-sulfatase, partial [Planctomycetes bacterium]|nr:Cerebroside-sulfatase [Planctomycetota bacterium]
MTAISCALTISLANADAKIADDRPNIVLIMADDVGCDAIGCYGGESYPTPHIDRLAADGMRFKHCYSMPSCHPTRIFLLTGRYPRRLKNP